MESLETDTVEELRRQIDRIDLDLVSTLSRRADLIAQLGRVKSRQGLPLKDPERERVVLASVQGANRGPYSAHDLTQVFRAVFDVSLRLMASRRKAQP